jgi:hypothetical protein
MRNRIGNLAFLSYRGSVKEAIEPVSNWLAYETRSVDNVTFIKPEKLARDYEIMMPFECFEFMMAIGGTIEGCDTFVYLNSEDYFQSIWTNLEIMGWLFFTRSPVGYSIGSDSIGSYTLDQVQWEPMPENSKPLWSQIRSHLEPFAMLRHRDAPYRGGQFSRKHYLLPCRVCGEYSLLPKKLTESQAKRRGEIRCAHPRCRAVHSVKYEGDYNRFRYRVPILAIPRSEDRVPYLRPLSSDEMLQLYADRKNPPPLIQVGSD